MKTITTILFILLQLNMYSQKNMTKVSNDIYKDLESYVGKIAIDLRSSRRVYIKRKHKKNKTDRDKIGIELFEFLQKRDIVRVKSPFDDSLTLNYYESIKQRFSKIGGGTLMTVMPAPNRIVYLWIRENFWIEYTLEFSESTYSVVKSESNAERLYRERNKEGTFTDKKQIFPRVTYFDFYYNANHKVQLDINAYIPGKHQLCQMQYLMSCHTNLSSKNCFEYPDGYTPLPVLLNKYNIGSSDVIPCFKNEIYGSYSQGWPEINDEELYHKIPSIINYGKPELFGFYLQPYGWQRRWDLNGKITYQTFYQTELNKKNEYNNAYVQGLTSIYKQEHYIKGKFNLQNEYYSKHRYYIFGENADSVKATYPNGDTVRIWNKIEYWTDGIKDTIKTTHLSWSFYIDDEPLMIYTYKEKYPNKKQKKRIFKRRHLSEYFYRFYPEQLYKQEKTNK